MKKDNLPRYLTPNDVAEMLKIDVKTVWNWCKAGRLPALHISGKYWRIAETEVENFIKGQTYARNN